MNGGGLILGGVVLVMLALTFVPIGGSLLNQIVLVFGVAAMAAGVIRIARRRRGVSR